MALWGTCPSDERTHWYFAFTSETKTSYCCLLCSSVPIEIQWSGYIQIGKFWQKQHLYCSSDQTCNSEPKNPKHFWGFLSAKKWISVKAYVF